MLDVCPEIPREPWEAHLEDDLRAMAAARLGIELEAQCVRRLANAWSDLNYRYLRSRLHSPSIRLHDGDRRWGAWDPGRRLITIARRQVLCYTWESALETLEHEMAHQFVSEALGRGDEPAHGPAFREACRLLAIDPVPYGDGGVPLMRPGGAGAAATAADARVVRIQKLLALADNNPDEHEARAAFARASELMLKHNLAAGDLERRDYIYRYLGSSTGRIPHHHYLIAGILQEFFFVQCIWVDSYVVATGMRGHLLEILGTRANVAVADYVHACLVRQCEALWQAFKRERGIADRRAKRQYLDGLLSGFRRQLLRTARLSRERGLIWIGDPGLDAFFQRRYPRTSRARLDSVSGSEVREQGIQAGERLRLHRPLPSAPATSRGHCLPCLSPEPRHS